MHSLTDQLMFHCEPLFKPWFTAMIKKNFFSSLQIAESIFVMGYKWTYVLYVSLKGGVAKPYPALH